MVLRAHRQGLSPVRLVDRCTEKDPRIDQNVDTSLGNLLFQRSKLSLTAAGRGIDPYMAILVLIALGGDLDLGLRAQRFG
jgi:hypothetical protein